MKPSLQLQPIATDLTRILHKFEQGEPLLCDELNFLARYEKVLSAHGLDPVIKYYLNYLHEHPKQQLSFQLPQRPINEISLHEIQENVQTLLKNNLSHIDLKMTQEQFMKFKLVGFNEMHFWTTHQLLMGVNFPFRGLPRFLYLQWGKLFGVVQLTFANDGKELEGDVLVYFEDIAARNLYQCIADYTNKYEKELALQKKLSETNHLREENVIQSRFQLTPGKPTAADEDGKK